MAFSAPQTLLQLALQTSGEIVVDRERLNRDFLIENARRVATGLHEHRIGHDDGVVLMDDGSGADLLSALLGSWWVSARPTVLAGTAAETQIAAVSAQVGASLTVSAAASPGSGKTVTHAWLRDNPVTSLGPVCGAGDIALDCATSGTTGPPKVVTFTHQALHHNIRAYAERLDLGRHDVLYTPLPLSIAGVVGMVLLPALFAGSTVHLGRLSGTNLAHVHRELRDVRPTLLYGVPNVFEFIVSQRQAGGFERLRWAICSSAPLPPATFDKIWRRLGVPPRSSYCLAEAGTVTLNTSSDLDVLRTTVGQPLDGTTISFESADGGDGRIVIGGDSCGVGYRSNGEVVPFPRGVVRTQDRGRFTGPYLNVLGRVDDVIQVAGHNVDLQHISNVLGDCPGLGEFAVVAGQHGATGVVPVLLLVADSFTTTTEQVIAYCRRSLRDVEVPREVRLVSELSRTATGKIRRTVTNHGGEEKP